MILIAISVFSLFHPRELVVRPIAGKQSSLVEARVIHLADKNLPFMASGDFTLGVPEKIERRFHGKLTVSSAGKELLAVVEMDIETAVASVVAAESPPGAPFEALRAQAVAARSFFTASHGRHKGYGFCDTTHCQFLRQPAEPGESAWRATESTRGLTLAYHGRIIAALYSADCGGHTDSAVTDDFPYLSAECPRKGGARRGHGLGLCQEGAAALAASGEDYQKILSHYYPGILIH